MHTRFTCGTVIYITAQLSIHEQVGIVREYASLTNLILIKLHAIKSPLIMTIMHIMLLVALIILK